MVRIIAPAMETGYDTEVPMRADVDTEMHKVGQQTPVAPDTGEPGATSHSPAEPAIVLPASPPPARARSRWLQGACFVLHHTHSALSLACVTRVGVRFHRTR